MSAPANEVLPTGRRPSVFIRLIVSLVVFLHLGAIIIYVIGAGGPFVMKQASSWIRPYLKMMWLDNAYRFYAPNPGPTEVIWYRLQYDDGSTRWTQLPKREDFYFRMPFQRHMSIALLASMMIEKEAIKPAEDAASVANILVNNSVSYKTVLTAAAEVYFRSYARHIARKEARHPTRGSQLVSMDCYMTHYGIRLPYDMRMNMDMYDPRTLQIQFIATYSPDGTMSNFEAGFRDRVADDLFIEIMQNEMLPLLEENDKLPAGQKQTIAQVIREFGVPYPLVQPILKLPEEEQRAFFQKPFDRDTLRERYAKAVKLYDIPLQKPSTPELLKADTKDTNTKPPGKNVNPEPAQRGIQ